MSNSIDPAATCGCCAGTDAETPVRIHNEAGLPSVVYRTGTYARFLESMLARLSSSEHPALKNLGARESDDLTIALCDGLASMLDILTFYQERLANEHYIRTSLEIRSLIEMARLIGYTPSPGVAASTYLAFKLQEAPGSPADSAEPIQIPERTRVQSIPGQDEEAQCFETSEEAEARLEWNGAPLQATVPWSPLYGDTDLFLEGVETRLEPGDAILIVGAHRFDHAESNRWDIRVLETVEPDAKAGRTRVTWADSLGHFYPRVYPAAEEVKVYAFRQRASLFGHNATDPNMLGRDGNSITELIEIDPAGSSNYVWKNYEISRTEIDLDAAYPKITEGSWVALASNDERYGYKSLPGYVELYRVDRPLQLSRSGFGISAKITRILPDTTVNLDPSTYSIRETLALVQSEELSPAARPLPYPVYGDEIALEERVEGLDPGKAIAVTGLRQRIAVAPGVTHLQLELDDGDVTGLSGGDGLVLLEAPGQVSGSASVYLDPETFGRRLGESSVRLELRVEDRDGRSGRLLAYADEIALEPSREDDEEVSEIAFIATGSDAVTGDRDRTYVKLSATLQHCYERVTARMNANVVKATQGETVEETLGSGDSSRPDQFFKLKQSPLTYVSADTPSGRSSTVSLRVNDLLWSEEAALYGRAGDERVYTVEVNDSGEATLRFGDGREGARIPTGQNNVRATYRKGLGVSGNVGAGKISNLLSRPLGVSEAMNPQAATGGEDGESLDQARENAPLTVLTLDRAVSIKDYSDFSRAFAGIDKAHAIWVPAGPARGVFITVAGVDGASVPVESETYLNLLDALGTYGDPLIPVTLADFRPVSFRLRMAVKAGADYDVALVQEDLEKKLKQTFGFDQRSFGQGTSIDEVLATAHSVDGVEAAQVIHLYRTDPGTSPSREMRLSASLPVASLTATPEAAELLTIDEDGIELEELP